MANTENILKQTARTSDAELGLGQRIAKDFVRNKYLYLMLLPVIGYYLVFHYGPMYGAVIAFQDFNPIKGIWGSKGSVSKISPIFLMACFFSSCFVIRSQSMSST